jgi:hypothetical protein
MCQIAGLPEIKVSTASGAVLTLNDEGAGCQSVQLVAPAQPTRVVLDVTLGTQRLVTHPIIFVQ